MPYFEHFQRIAKAFQDEVEIFDTRLFLFDTSVTEITDPDQQLRIGGGTYFHILEHEVQRIKTETGRHPDCIVVLTDGYGTSISPEAESKWIWLLTPPECKDYVPKSSRSWLISDVEYE